MQPSSMTKLQWKLDQDIMSLQVDPKDGPRCSREGTTRSGKHLNVNDRHYLCRQVYIYLIAVSTIWSSHSLSLNQNGECWTYIYCKFVIVMDSREGYIDPPKCSCHCCTIFYSEYLGFLTKGRATPGDYWSQLANVQVGNIILDLRYMEIYPYTL